MVVEGIKVTGMSGTGSLLSIPKLYTRKEIPVDKEEIASPAKIKEWKNLRSISNAIVQRDDVQVGLLTGTNCIKALEPTKSYIVKVVTHMPIKLGWVGVLFNQ